MLRMDLNDMEFSCSIFMFCNLRDFAWKILIFQAPLGGERILLVGIDEDLRGVIMTTSLPLREEW